MRFAGSGRTGRRRSMVVVAVSLLLLAALTEGCGSGRPEVGDCVSISADEDVNVVACDSPEAHYRLVAIDVHMMQLSNCPPDQVPLRFRMTDPVGTIGFCAEELNAADSP